jgi:hypothetical protein
MASSFKDRAVAKLAPHFVSEKEYGHLDAGILIKEHRNTVLQTCHSDSGNHIQLVVEVLKLDEMIFPSHQVLGIQEFLALGINGLEYGHLDAGILIKEHRNTVLQTCHSDSGPGR